MSNHSFVCRCCGRHDAEACLAPPCPFQIAPEEQDWNRPAQTSSSPQEVLPNGKAMLENMLRIVRNFQDRQPAMLKELRIHPDYKDVFYASLREEGFQKATGPVPLSAVPIYLDATVPYGEVKKVFAGDPI